ncbi:MAG: type II toxin-antitoxin system RelE/ParE family toxin [Burkholderiales bacterium]
MRCEFSERAILDLEEIGDFIARDNPVRAVSFIEDLRRRCETIAFQPFAAPLKPVYGEGVRQVPFGRYLIFYRAATNAVIIEHIRHSGRKSERLG